MARMREETSIVTPGGGSVTRRLRRLWGMPAATVGLLALIWVALPLVPEGTGLQFGTAYRAFFTILVVAAALFFWLLGRERVPQPRSTAGVLGSVVLVYLITVGLLVGAGALYPQFARPRPAEMEAARGPLERGKRLFWSESVGCFRCHTVDGRGGTRAPDLTQVAARAGDRVPGLPAEEYLRAKIRAGLNYDFKVPGYAPIMPPFATVLSDAQFADVIAFLLASPEERRQAR